MEEILPFGRDPDRAEICGHCGWEGPDTLMGTSGPLGDPSTTECPTCHAPIASEMPSASEIAAARRAPGA